MARKRGDIPGVIAPPPLLFAGMLLLGLAIQHVVPAARTGLPRRSRVALGGGLLFAAAALSAAALGRFRRAGTPVEPWHPSTTLVTSGVYRLTRNPLYVAMSLIYTGLALFADSAVALFLLPPVLTVVRYGVIGREERYLEAKFGAAYRAYLATVRRWI